MAEQLSSSRVVARNAVFSVAGYLVSAAYLVALLPIIVHFLGTEQFGLWSLVLAVTGYVGLVDLGLSTSFVKYVAEYVAQDQDDQVNSVVRHGFLFYLALSGLLLLVGFLAGRLVFPLLSVPPDQLELAWNAMMLALVAFGVNNLSFVFVSVLSGLQRLDAYNIFQTAVTSVRFLAIGLTLFLGGDLLAMMAADVAVSTASLLPLWILTKRFFPSLSVRLGEFDAAMFSRLVRFGGQLQASRLAEVVQTQFDKLLIARFLGLSLVGMYEFGSRPLARLRAFPMAAMAGLLPAMSALDSEDNQERILAGVVRSTRYVIVFGLPVFTFVAVFAQPIVRVWLGEGFALAGIALQILAAGYLMSVVSAPLALAAQGRGEPRFQMQATLTQAVLNIILSLALIIAFGYAGAAAGTCLASITGSLLLIRLYGHRIMQDPFATYGRILARPLLAAATGVSAGLAAGALSSAWVGDQSRGEVLVGLIFSLGAFVLFYGLMVAKLRVLGPDDRGFLMNILPSRLLLLFTREKL